MMYPQVKPLTATATLIALTALTATSLPSRLAAQEAGVAGSAVTLSAEEATLELEMADGTRHRISLEDGRLRVDGAVKARIAAGSSVDRSWRALLRSPDALDPKSLARRLRDWRPEAEGGREREAAEALTANLRTLIRPPELPTALPETVTAEGPDGAQLAIAPGILSFSELADQLNRLHRSLEALGKQAAGADEGLALVVHDDYRIAGQRTIPGNLALLDGELDLEGTVRGDVLVLDGTLLLEPTAHVAGDVLQAGGEVERLGGRVDGEILSVVPVREAAAAVAGTPSGGEAAEQHVAPPAPAPGIVSRDHRGFFGTLGRNISRAFRELVTVLSLFIGLGIAGILAVVFGRRQLEVTADTARANFGRSFAVGLGSEILFFPAVAIACVTIIGIPIAVLALFAFPFGLLGGYLALAHATGESVSLQRYTWIERLRLRRSNSYYYVLSGLAVLLAPFAIAGVLHLLGGLLGVLRGLTLFAAGVATWVAATTGLGALVLTRGGRRTIFVRPVDRRAGADTFDGLGDYDSVGSEGA